MELYKKALKFLEKIEKKRLIKLGLSRVERALALFGNPHLKPTCIHVAGTNGKGSVCAFTAKILQEACYKVGLYTSPYLSEPTEKIRVNGKRISKNEYGKLILKIKQKTEKRKIKLTFFEYNTVAAFIYFAKQNVDFAVLETGMGGRLDATNVCNAKIAAITNVELDHMEYLGNTKLKIAKEKAGIIKSHQIVVTAEKDPKIVKLFRKICKEKNSKLITIRKKCKFKLGLLGEYQKLNAAVATEIAKQLKIPLQHIKNGLRKTKWPARMQILEQKPFVLYDGAHNPAGIEALVESLKKMKIKSAVFVVGFSKGKDAKKMFEKIGEICREIVITESDYKAQQAEVIAKFATKFSKVIIEKNPKKALKIAKIVAINKPIIICGSLYLAKFFIHSLDL